MPPRRVRSSQDSVYQEGHVLLAIHATNTKYEVTSIHSATDRIHVPCFTLQRRLRGTTNHVETRANSQKIEQGNA